MFPNLHKCIQVALQHCNPSFNKLLQACEFNTHQKCTNDNKKLQYAIKSCSSKENLINNACYKKCPKEFVQYGILCLKPYYIKRKMRLNNSYERPMDPIKEELYSNDFIVEKCSNYGKNVIEITP